MLEKIKNNFQNLTPTKYNRIKNYISILDENIDIKDQRDKRNVEEIKIISEKLISKLKTYYNVNIILYIAIYFSFVSYFFTDIIILSDIAEVIRKVVSLVGTTIFLISLFFSHKIIELYYQDLNLLTTHLITIYSKHQKAEITEIMGNEKNKYEAFIEFFKERYK